jgi:hypothetical protein
VKTRISIQLSKAVLAEVDLLAGTKRPRSGIIECILRQFLIEQKKSTLHAWDLEQLNRLAAQLNLEAAEALKYQHIDENLEDVEDRHLAGARIKKRGKAYTTTQLGSKLGLGN